ncbi:MAG: YceI family protein [Pseudomonadota bacterium]
MLSSPVQAAPESYTLDAMHSMPSFSFMHLNLSQFRGRFDKVSGNITLDLTAHAGSAEIAIDLASVSTGVPMLDTFMKGPRFFDVATFPTASFKSVSFKFDGDRLAMVAGELTLHGVTRPVQLDVAHFACRPHPLLKVQSCGADATVTIKRADFGLDIFLDNDSNEVKLELAIEALKGS